jgi:phosphoglycerate dehydrogenase-like enzyme
MPQVRPKILVTLGPDRRSGIVDDEQLARLEAFADIEWFACEGGRTESAGEDPETGRLLAEEIEGYDGLVLGPGAPRVDAAMLEKAVNLKIIGELHGDRFSARLDLEAAWDRGIRTVDTTNASSYPVAEWALALIIISLRNVGAQFREVIAGKKRSGDPTPYRGALRGRRVGMIGCGHMGRRLISYLKPFQVELWVYDPYLPREMADALDFLQTSLDNVLSQCDVIVCVAPLTPGTRGMIGKREIEMIPSGSAFVNVSRGAIVDSEALIARLKRGDITAGLEVWDPEPVPEDSEIRNLPNAFVTTHTSSRRGDEQNEFFELMVDEFERFFHGHETKFDLTPTSRANRSGSERKE